MRRSRARPTCSPPRTRRWRERSASPSRRIVAPTTSSGCVSPRPGGETLLMGGNRRLLGRLRDLADDLDDVAVRVPDAPLAVRAVAAREDLADAFQLAIGAELAGVRLDLVERAAHELRDRHAIPGSTVEVHHGRLEPVAGGKPLVLGGEDPVVRRDLGAHGVALAEELDEGLAEGGERDRVLDARHGVADADLDRAE